jgi:hypothetical protein
MDRNYRNYPTVLLPQVIVDLEWEEGRGKMGRGFLQLFSCHKSLVTRSGNRREIRWQGISVTFLLLPQVTGDQEWEEEGEQMGKDYLTGLLLPQSHW